VTARIRQFEIFAVDLPFRTAFEHAAAKRESSDSLFLKCTLDSGTVGFGECLPRTYVTGETRDGAFAMLQEDILPKLINKEFADLHDVRSFLHDCDGKAPPDWIDPHIPQTAAWCAIDLALLDACSREFRIPLFSSDNRANLRKARYSAVISSGKSFGSLLMVLMARLYGISQVKLKVERSTSVETIKRVRRILGRRCNIRIDANMAWEREQALALMKEFSKYGIRSVEQPLPVDRIDDSADLVRRSEFEVMADESVSDRESLDQLIEKKACTEINARISKCGGLTATMKRCQESIRAGMIVQIGCQVGESSLLSAAHLLLTSQLPEAEYLEGCFGLLLLKEDPAKPLLQFGYGGRPPQVPAGNGLGVAIDEEILKRWTRRSATIQ
jgi:L-alanine-DL-glutamate epimerase-like enolase superfamily enzyme